MTRADCLLQSIGVDHELEDIASVEAGAEVDIHDVEEIHLCGGARDAYGVAELNRCVPRAASEHSRDRVEASERTDSARIWISEVVAAQ